MAKLKSQDKSQTEKQARRRAPGTPRRDPESSWFMRSGSGVG